MAHQQPENTPGQCVIKLQGRLVSETEMRSALLLALGILAKCIPIELSAIHIDLNDNSILRYEAQEKQHDLPEGFFPGEVLIKSGASFIGAATLPSEPQNSRRNQLDHPDAQRALESIRRDLTDNLK